MPDETPKELMEVALAATPAAPTEPKQNPVFGLVSEQKWDEYTQGVKLPALVGGIAGAFAVGVIPNLVKWNTGWKDIVVSLATTLLGGLVIGKMNKAAAYGWVLGGGIVTAVKGLRMVLGAKPELKILGDGLGGNLIYDVDVGADYDEFFGADEELFGEDEALFGIGEDPIIPTADADY